MSMVDGEPVSTSGGMPASAGTTASLEPAAWRAPMYPTPSVDTAAFRAARGGWIAEQHFVYEVTNDADIILLSMATAEPLVTVVLQPDESSGTGFRIALCRSVDEQHAFYRASRGRRHIVQADVFTSVGADWYGFVEGLLTHRVLETGELTSTHMCGVLPVSMLDDVIIGEIGFGVPVVDQPAQTTIEARRRMRHVQEERTRALQAGDLDRLAQCYSPAATVVERSYPSGQQVVLSGRDSVLAFYDERIHQWSGPRVERIVSHAADWYGFEELLWAGNRNGYAEQFRTAAVFQPSDDHQTIGQQIGYGTSLSVV
jgi:hypothetical protein